MKHVKIYLALSLALMLTGIAASAGALHFTRGFLHRAVYVLFDRQKHVLCPRTRLPSRIGRV